MKKYEEIKNGLYCGSICILSVPDAYDRMDMCAYDRTGFGQFQKFIPWIALILLLYIGGSMIKESMQSEEEKEEVKRLSFAVLMMQGIATSIDALSVGFTTAGYDLVMAVVCSLIVAVVTFVICETGLCLGKTLGTKLSGKADVLGGVILIGIGIVSWGRGM